MNANELRKLADEMNEKNIYLFQLRSIIEEIKKKFKNIKMILKMYQKKILQRC
ncbi:MAG: hypothetical protein QXF35_02640 [Candidatus Bilamarchaeaceae archaeon]